MKKTNMSYEEDPPLHTEKSISNSFCLDSQLYQKYMTLILPVEDGDLEDPNSDFAQCLENQEDKPISTSGALVDVVESRSLELIPSNQSLDLQQSFHKKQKKKKRYKEWDDREQRKPALKKDQNMCKKYNSIALKILESLIEIERSFSSLKQKIYRQDFFIIMLLLAEQGKVLEQFQKAYRQETSDLIKDIKSKKKIDKKQRQRNNDLVRGVNRSLACLELFKQNSVQQARLRLFNLQKLRNNKFIQSSKKLICEVQSTIKFKKRESNF